MLRELEAREPVFLKKLGQLSTREGNFGDEIEKQELPQRVLNRQEGGQYLLYEW